MVPEILKHIEFSASAIHASQNGSQPSDEKNVEARTPEPETARTGGKAKDLEQALSRVREVFQKADSRLEFTIDPDLDRVVVKVMDGDSGTVIRQIPQQEVIDLAKRLETPTGLLLHHKV